eukprot:314902-Rhodomonas_salina.3
MAPVLLLPTKTKRFTRNDLTVCFNHQAVGFMRSLRTGKGGLLLVGGLAWMIADTAFMPLQSVSNFFTVRISCLERQAQNG